MPRLSATPGALGAAIAAAVALWWLPGAWLQAASGFAGLPDLSARAAFYLLLAQAVLVPLFAARWFGDELGAVGARIAGDVGGDATAGFESRAVGARIAGDATLRAVASPAMRAPTGPVGCAVGALLAVAPAWPLLVLLWLTSELSAYALVASQFMIVFLAVLLAWLGGTLARSSLGDWTTDVLRGAAGLVPAAIAWSLRGGLQAWVLP